MQPRPTGINHERKYARGVIRKGINHRQRSGYRPATDELREFAQKRGWEAVEFVDQGISGTKAKRPALDEMLRAVKTRKIDVVIVWRMDRRGEACLISCTCLTTSRPWTWRLFLSGKTST